MKYSAAGRTLKATNTCNGVEKHNFEMLNRRGENLKGREFKMIKLTLETNI